MNTSFYVRFFATLFFLAINYPSYAHVKWFSQYSFGDEPLQLSDVTNSIFWILAVASMLVVSLFTIISKHIKLAQWYNDTCNWLGKHNDKSLMIMRIAAGVVLLMSWKSGTLIMPELSINSDLLKWFQFLLAVLLLFRITIPLVGVGIILLYTIGIYQFSLFHMLDYLLLLGIAYFFITSDSKNLKLKNAGLLAIYLTVGFSLCWAGMEKLIYPHWGTYLLELHPQLALGLKPDLFIQGAAFIEISVGIMFILGYFQRILAVVVTLLFMLTSIVFKETEVIGHLMIHAALIIFLIEGSGNIFKILPPAYGSLSNNPFYAGLAFAILFFAFITPYTYGANLKYEQSVAEQPQNHIHPLEISDAATAPQLEVSIKEDIQEGWNIELMTHNFKFVPPKDTEHPFKNEGYAILSINGKLHARIYSPWFYLPPMQTGAYNIEISLKSSHHEPLTHLGLPIETKDRIVVE